RSALCGPVQVGATDDRRQLPATPLRRGDPATGRGGHHAMRDSLGIAQRIGLASAVLPIADTLPRALDERVRRVIVRAVMDLVAVVEQPLGSNRGPEIDRYLRSAQVPES